MMGIDGKSVLITGAASGIGRSAARAFAEAGADLVLTDIRDDVNRVASDVAAETGSRAVAFPGDVADSDDVRRIVDGGVDAYGGIDVLYNNAGISHPYEGVQDIDEEQWDRVVEVNLKSVFLTTKHVLPHMRTGGGGSIVNTASSVAIGAPEIPGLAAYTASKGGVVSLTKQIAQDAKEFDVRANAICPGATDTDLFRERRSDAEIEAAVDATPFGELTRPTEVAKLALYLASDAAAKVSGTAIPINSIE